MVPLSLAEVKQLVQLYKTEHEFRKSLYSSHNIKPFINRPFPPDISENLVRNFVELFELRQCLWTPEEDHDLILLVTGRKLEVKAFTNDAQQLSFTCTQKFDVLYVLDCRDFVSDKYVLHIFEFSATDMQEMEVGMDSLQAKFLSDEQRPVRVSLKRLMKFAEQKGYYHEIHTLKLNEHVQLISEGV